MRSLTQFLALIMVFFLNCQSDTDNAKEKLTPEEVLKLYQAHFDKNEFNEAMSYSTPAGKLWIEDIAPMIRGEFGEETITNTIFHEVNCEVQQDTATCKCLLEDETETYEALYRLIRIKKVWLVDAPDEEHSIEYEDREEIFDDGFLQK